MQTKKRLLIFHPTIAPYRIDLFNDLNRNFDSSVSNCKISGRNSQMW